MNKNVSAGFSSKPDSSLHKSKSRSLKERFGKAATTCAVIAAFAVTISLLIYSSIRFVSVWAKDTADAPAPSIEIKPNREETVNPETSTDTRELDFVYERPDTRKEPGIYLNGKNKNGGIRFSIFPVRGNLTGHYGVRNNPFNEFGFLEFHAGLDVGAPLGTPVRAAARGVVISAGWDGGYGNVVIIAHDGNKVTTRYAHLSRVDVAAGDVVTGGTQIGLVGSTGRSTGPHLHFEVRIDGETVNPLSVYPSNK